MSEKELAEQYSVVESYFIRDKNILMLEADLEWLYNHFQQHVAQHEMQASEQIQQIFWQGLAAFALHCASKPKHQVFAWTINLGDPCLNLFYGGDTDWDAVAGRWFTENVDIVAQNRFFQEVAGRQKEVSRSFVPFQGHDLLMAAETFYRQSEQRPARFFQLSNTRFLMLAAHPDYDEEWFHSRTQESLHYLQEKETLVFMERRPVHWKCGCTQEKILRLLLPLYREDPENLMGEESVITVQCPRCATRHRVTREMLEAQDVQEIIKGKP